MSKGSYLLITRVRDEAGYLPALFESVENQTVRPALWVVVDHASTDDAPALLSKYAARNSWVKVVNAPRDRENSLFTHSRPLRIGFSAAIEQAEKNGVAYDYLGIQDADIQPEVAYYEKLMAWLRDNPAVGIIGGRLYIPVEGGEKPEDNGGVVRGGSRLYRKQCFEDIGGEMPESAIWDTETDIMASLRGWTSLVRLDAYALHKRATATRKGIMRGYWRRGACYYYADYHPFSAIVLAVLLSFKQHLYAGPVFLSSFVVSWFKRIPKSPNAELRNYFRSSFRRSFKGGFSGIRQTLLRK